MVKILHLPDSKESPDILHCRVFFVASCEQEDPHCRMLTPPYTNLSNKHFLGVESPFYEFEMRFDIYSLINVGCALASLNFYATFRALVGINTDCLWLSTACKTALLMSQTPHSMFPYFGRDLAKVFGSQPILEYSRFIE